MTSLSLNPPDPSPPSIITTILTNVFVKKPYTLTSSTTCNRPKYVSIVLWPESIRSSMISRALCARKWYFSEGDGAGSGGDIAGELETCSGVVGGLGKGFRKSGLFWVSLIYGGWGWVLVCL